MSLGETIWHKVRPYFPKRNVSFVSAKSKMPCVASAKPKDWDTTRTNAQPRDGIVGCYPASSSWHGKKVTKLPGMAPRIRTGFGTGNHGPESE
ncbi:MAG TPA: hypothetical protein VKV15_23470 [Bryobacteraceae bacterium]|nr:hypothetical protein [Bryobacteraceae bacterium]